MTPALPDDLRDLLFGALDPDPPAPEVDARVKQRVLQAIAAGSTPAHHTVHGRDDGWHAIGKGLTRKVLHQAGGVMSYLLRLAPGATIPPHRHPMDEECVVLEGELRIGSLRLAAGGFHLARAGSLHEAICSDDGALVFLRGAAPVPSQLV